MEVCARCGVSHTTRTLRPCWKCKTVCYCSLNCAALHWSQHKNSCTVDSSASQQSSAKKTTPDDGKSTSQQTGTRASVSDPWQAIKLWASEAFPGNQVLDIFRDIDQSGMDVTCLPLPPLKSERFHRTMGVATGVSLVMKLISPLFHPQRRIWAVTDMTGDHAHVTFSTPEVTAPHFQYEDLKKGHFLCVKDADIRFFPQAVYFIDVKEAGFVRVCKPEQCVNCGTRGDAEAILRCSGCKAARYCSRVCQKAHWSLHKDHCKRIKELLERMTFIARWEMPGLPRESSRTEFATSVLGHVRVTPHSLTWEEARARARRLFPLKEIVDQLWRLKTDRLYKPNTDTVVALVLVKGVYPHNFRQGRYLEDCEGTTTFVIFHVKGDPMPYFSYDKLIEGRFMCYQNAYIHFFGDGTVGFRIDDPQEVHILDSVNDIQ